MNNWKLTPEQILTAGPIVPVIVINELSQAVPLAKALISGGVKVLEVTLRTECAIDAIRLIAQEVPEAIVGAGTVINSKQLQAVTEAGAQFAISPGLTDNLLDAAVKGSIPLIPGISSVSELMLGMNYGLTEFKFSLLKRMEVLKPSKLSLDLFLKSVFAQRGISPANYRDYLALDSVLCIGGSWIVPADALQQGDYARITQLAKDAVAVRLLN